MNDQENIKRIQQVDNRTRKIMKIGQRSACDGRAEEWEQIRLEMEAGATEVVQKNNFFEDKSSMASILHTLEKELQSQGDAVAEFEKQDWQDEGEWIAQGWCEALEFAIKTIKQHNKTCKL
jgi:hypothetical protein